MKMTELEMRTHEVPAMPSLWHLFRYLWSLRKYRDDYGTAAYAMSLAAVAAFRYMARYVGATGFQASCADLDIVRRTRHMEGPFMLISLNDALYPQYDLPGRVTNFIDENRDWLSDEAQKKLSSDGGTAHPDVVAHWRFLADTALSKEPKP